jgi:hypothetical protein
MGTNFLIYFVVCEAQRQQFRRARFGLPEIEGLPGVRRVISHRPKRSFLKSATAGAFSDRGTILIGLTPLNPRSCPDGVFEFRGYAMAWPNLIMPRGAARFGSTRGSM